MESTAITIKPVTSSLYHRYPVQTSEQPVYVELDCAVGELTAETSGEIGNAVPMSVWHGHTQRWAIPVLKINAANKLLRELAPLAARVCAGYAPHWDGHNHVARFTTDADNALEEIEATCGALADDGDAMQVWQAADWYAALGNTARQRTALLIDATTTDAMLDLIETQELASAKSNGIDGVDGLAKYLRDLRDEAVALALAANNAE
jgi:hypothetical protein